MRKSVFCLCENKGVDELCSNCTADQRFCFRYMDSISPFVFKYETSSFLLVPSTLQSVCV